MTNGQIAKSLEMLADLLEFQGSDAFRLRAYRNAARAIVDHAESLEQVVAAGGDLTRIQGIGKGVAEKCKQLVQTGSLHQLDDLLKSIPKTVLDLLRVPKLGPKKAALLFNELKIENLSQLKTACETGQIRALPGFGEKTEQAILKGIDIAAAANERIYWSEADILVTALRKQLASCAAIRHSEFAGSYRRGQETVGHLDILIVADDAQEAMDCLAMFPQVKSVTDRGPTFISLQLADAFQIEVRAVPANSFGAALIYFTGSKEHNLHLRGLAKDHDLNVNEWGVFSTDDSTTPVCGKSEEEVYASLGMAWIPPELREARREFEWATANKLPKLIERGDLVGDLHMHTTATDGSASILDMVAAAKAQGLKYIAITDHSKRVAMANGLDPKRLRAQWNDIDRINQALDGEFFVFKGVECDILENAKMDLPDDVLREADWVLASIHYGQEQSRRQLTDRIMAAIRHPWITAIAHPTGRLINRRKPYEIDIDAVMQAAVEHRKIFELNANPARLDLNDIHCAMAKMRGIKITINSDAHSPHGIDVLKYGIIQARRGGLTKDDVVNCLPLSQIRIRLAKSQ